MWDYIKDYQLDISQLTNKEIVSLVTNNNYHANKMYIMWSNPRISSKPAM